MASAAFRTRPTPVGRSIPAEFPSQIGVGEAQLVPEGDLSGIIAGQQQRRAAEKEAATRRRVKLEKELEVAKPNLLPRDEKRFEQMRSAYYQYKFDNINNLNDPEVKARLKQEWMELKDLGIKSSGLYKEVIRRSAATAKGDWENTENFDALMDPSYVGTEEDYLAQHVGGWKLLNDIKVKPKPFNLAADIRLNVIRIMNAAKDRGQTTRTLDDGSVHTTEVTELTDEEAKAILRQNALEPPVAKAIETQFGQLSEEEQAQYNDPVDWYTTVWSTLFTGKQIFEKSTKPTGAGLEFTFGSGRASNKKWNFVDTVQTPDKFDWTAETTFLPKEVISALKKRQATEKKVSGDRRIHTVRIQNIGTETENKPISIQVDEEGSRVYAFPIGWRYEEGKEDKAVLIIGQKVGTGADAEWLIDEVPAIYSSGDIEAVTKMTLQRFIDNSFGVEDTRKQKTETGLSVIKTQAEYNALPIGTRYKDSKGDISTKR